VARDRKRAKQRQQRRDRTRSSVAPASQPIRRDVPGALDHASGEVDEFDAAIVRGAGGAPVSPEQDDEPERDGGEQAAEPLAQAPREPDAEDPDGALELQDAEFEQDEETQQAQAALPRARRQSLSVRTVAFLRASWAELHRVQWPDRSQVFQGTAVVLGFVTIAGLYLGGADVVAKEIVEAIL
jgi:preprotein translocase subunit SecE